MPTTNPMTTAKISAIDQELPNAAAAGASPGTHIYNFYEKLRALEAKYETQNAFAYDSSSSSGLTFAYSGGRYHTGKGSATTVAAGTVALTGSATNYVEVTPSTGAVSANTSSFTSGRIPLYTVVTGSSSFSDENVTDQRAFTRRDLRAGHREDGRTRMTSPTALTTWTSPRAANRRTISTLHFSYSTSRATTLPSSASLNVGFPTPTVAA